MASNPHQIVIWLFTDGKPGHENQSQGLVNALSRLVPVEVVRLPALPFWKTLVGKLLHKNFILNLAPKPDLLIGAGHATHSALMLLRWLYKAKSILLMKPSLPIFLFDLCLIPEHDGAVDAKRVIATKGVLNKIDSTADKKINQGMMLIGGPSTHYRWNHVELIDQIMQILSAMPHIEWIIADSRRTPEETKQGLHGLVAEKVKYVPVELTDKSWLPAKLAESRYCWVTEDSVSMLYEALTAKNHVGLLSVPQVKQSRISKGVEVLLNEGFVKTFQQWHVDENLDDTHFMASEADRCAKEIVERWQLKD